MKHLILTLAVIGIAALIWFGGCESFNPYPVYREGRERMWEVPKLHARSDADTALELLRIFKGRTVHHHHHSGHGGGCFISTIK